MQKLLKHVPGLSWQCSHEVKSENIFTKTVLPVLCFTFGGSFRKARYFVCITHLKLR